MLPLVKTILTVGSDDGSLPPPPLPSGTQDGWTALHYAIEGGHLEVVKVLVASKADVNAKNNVSTLLVPLLGERDRGGEGWQAVRGWWSVVGGCWLVVGG